MAIDHIGLAFFPDCDILRIIGRLAFPIFAYMIAEGYSHTKSKVKYFLRLFVLGAICQAVYYFAERSFHMNILLTFSVSLITMICIDNFKEKRGFLSCAALLVCASAVICALVILPIYVKGFVFDYGIIGIVLPILIYLMPSKNEKLLCLAMVLCVLASYSKDTQWYALLSVPLLILYNGKRGKARLKYLFYIFYPAHLATIYLIQMLIEKCA